MFVYVDTAGNEWLVGSGKRTLYRGNQDNLETVLGVYLWWLTKRGIISS